MRQLPNKDSALIAELKKRFVNTFNELDRSKNRNQVFSDFITCVAIAYQNHAMYGRLSFNQNLENEYLEIEKKYSQADFKKIKQNLHRNVVDLLEAYGAPHDVLGDLYMSLELGSKHIGQHFTPIEVSNLMANMIGADIPETIKKQGYFSVSDPACGAGSTLLAKVTRVIEAGYDPFRSMYVEGVDIDRTTALMCFIQLNLWHVPAKIYVGDSLKSYKKEVWKTTAYWRGNWAYRLGHANKPDPQLQSEHVKQAI